MHIENTLCYFPQFECAMSVDKRRDTRINQSTIRIYNCKETGIGYCTVSKLIPKYESDYCSLKIAGTHGCVIAQ